MKAATPVFLAALLLALPAPAAAAPGAAMWGCAPVGERRNILYLADQGSRSYVKFSGQRIPARLTATESEKRWTWGANAMALAPDNLVSYYEGDVVKAQFRCKAMK
jgi:hypothetical protein